MNQQSTQGKAENQTTCVAIIYTPPYNNSLLPTLDYAIFGHKELFPMRVFACMASSLDGKIGPAGVEHFVPLGSQHDLNHLVSLRDEADAVLFGAKTYRAWPKPHAGTDKKRILQHFIMSHSLNLDWGSELFQHAEIPVTVFTTRKNGGRDGMPAHVDIVEEADMSSIISHVQAQNVKSLLVEGGGQVLNQLIETKALQELYLTLVPALIGQPDAPGLLAGSSLSKPCHLEVLGSKQIGAETYLHLKFNY
jgi:riboflavin biosynthesis pyrimidine reductase